MRIAFLPLVALALVAAAAHAEEPSPPASAPADPSPGTAAPPPTAAPVSPDASPPVEFPAPVLDTEPNVKGFELGLRTGYARAIDAQSGSSLTLQTPSLLPLVIDAGYRAGPHAYVGATLLLALASRTNCGGADACSARDYRFGGTFQYHTRPFAFIDPWFGLGVGYEIMHLSGFLLDTGGHITRTGIVLLDAQIGVDFPLGKGPMRPKIGPFVGLALGSSNGESGRVYGHDVKGSASSTDYEWVMIGVRANAGL